MSGIHPGFSCDYLVSTLLSVADRVDSVRAIEICDYSMAPNEFEMKTGRGFGMPTDFVAVCENPAFMQATWGPCVDLIADSLGYQVESYKTNYEKALTDHDLQVGYGTIKAGTVGAVRLSITGVINGKDAITVGAVNRMGADVAPEFLKKIILKMLCLLHVWETEHLIFQDEYSPYSQPTWETAMSSIRTLLPFSFR